MGVSVYIDLKLELSCKAPLDPVHFGLVRIKNIDGTSTNLILVEHSGPVHGVGLDAVVGSGNKDWTV